MLEFASIFWYKLIYLDVFVSYFEYVRSLTFTDEPNYEKTKKMLQEALEKVEKGEPRPFDWMMGT